MGVALIVPTGRTNILTDVGQECIAALLASKKHEIVIFTRKVNTTCCLFCLILTSLQDVPVETTDSPVKSVKANYKDVDELTSRLQGVDVVLSFIAPHDLQEGVSFQKNLIDASIRAGVKRFAPSEWVTYVATITTSFNIS